MKIFHKKDDTIGITLYRRKNKAIELWYTKPNGRVSEHYHENINSKIVYLFGGGILGRNEDIKILKLSDLFKSFSVVSGSAHRLVAFGFGLLFLNIETLLNDSTQSAAQDYHAVTQ